MKDVLCVNWLRTCRLYLCERRFIVTTQSGARRLGRVTLGVPCTLRRAPLRANNVAVKRLVRHHLAPAV